MDGTQVTSIWREDNHKKPHKMECTDLGRIIKKLRNERGISQEELAKKTGVSKRTVCGWECGQNMNVENVIRVLDVLGASLRVVRNDERRV